MSSHQLKDLISEQFEVIGWLRLPQRSAKVHSQWCLEGQSARAAISLHESARRSSCQMAKRGSVSEGTAGDLQVLTDSVQKLDRVHPANCCAEHTRAVSFSRSRPGNTAYSKTHEKYRQPRYCQVPLPDTWRLPTIAQDYPILTQPVACGPDAPVGSLRSSSPATFVLRDSVVPPEERICGTWGPAHQRNPPRFRR